MTIKRHFFCFLLFFVTTQVLVASPKTRLQARKRAQCLALEHTGAVQLSQNYGDKKLGNGRKRFVCSEPVVSNICDSGKMQEPDIKRISPETPLVQGLSLEEVLSKRIPTIKSELLEDQRVKPDFLTILKEERPLKGLVLSEDDVADVSQSDARWLVHMSIRQRYSHKESLFLLVEKCSLDAIHDLIIEASIANCASITHLLVVQAQRLDRENDLAQEQAFRRHRDNDLSTFSYHAMAIGYHLARCQESLNEKESQDVLCGSNTKKTFEKTGEQAVTHWFKNIYATDALFKEAVKEVEYTRSIKPF